MALAAFRYGRTLRLVRAFASSTITSPSTAALADSSAGTGLSHLFGYSHLYGFQKPCPPWRQFLARCWQWTEPKDTKHWLVTLDFPKDPPPTREEMINTYVKTLARVLGSEEEAKRKIYALSTTTYTGFQCNVDEATSEKIKEQPLVNWVLPDGCGELGIITGDKYENGVITPDPNPPKPYNERPRNRNYDRMGRDPNPPKPYNERPTNRNYDRMGFERQTDLRPMEGRRNTQSEHGDNYNYSSTERRPPFEQRSPMQGYQRENMQPGDQRARRLPIDRRDSYQGEQSDILYDGQRESVRREGQGGY